MQKIVFHKLLGFGTLTPGRVDFSDDTFGAKLGAKVGSEATNFPDEIINAKLGAKVGEIEPVAPSED